MHPIPIQDRLKGSIWGQFIGSTFSPEYSEIRSFYGDAALLMLTSLTRQHGFAARDFGTLYVETFASPDYPQLINQTTEETIENYHFSLEEGHPDLGYEFQGGANTTTIDTATRLAPVVAFYWNDPKLLYIIDKATRVTQNNELTVAFMRSYARILSNLFQGQDFHQAIVDETNPGPDDTPLDTHVREKIKQALSLVSHSSASAAEKFGKGSLLDQCYPLAIQTALKHSNSFKNAIEENMKIEGDVNGRAAIIGSWLGASLGVNAIPEEWRKKLLDHSEIESAMDDLVL